MDNNEILKQMEFFIHKSKNLGIKDFPEIQKIHKNYQNNREIFDNLNDINKLKIIINFLRVYEDATANIFTVVDKINKDFAINKLNNYGNYNNIIKITINGVIKGENEYNVNHRKKYDLFINKIKMLSDVDSFFLDMVYELEKDLKDDTKFRELFFKGLEKLFENNLDNIKLTLNYMTKKFSASQIYLHFFQNYNSPIYRKNKNIILEIMENINDNEADINELKSLMEIQ